MENFLTNIIFFPGENPALFLWFLYSIIIMKLMTPLLLKINNVFLLIILVLFQILSLDIHFLGIGSVLIYIVYYYLGMQCSLKKNRFIDVMKMHWLPPLLALLFFMGYALKEKTGVVILPIIVAIFGLTLVISCCFCYGKYMPAKILKTLSNDSLQIYILQYFFIFPLYFYLKYLKVPSKLIVAATFIIGIVIPIVFTRLVVSKSKHVAILIGKKATRTVG